MSRLVLRVDAILDSALPAEGGVEVCGLYRLRRGSNIIIYINRKLPMIAAEGRILAQYTVKPSLVPQTPIRAHAKSVLNSGMWRDQSDSLVCNQHYVSTLRSGVFTFFT